jgi:DNA-directed RNA polymerase-4 subunit 1
MDELNDQMDQPTAVLKAIQFDLMTSADMVSFYFALTDFTREKGKVRKTCMHFQEISSSTTVIKGSDVTSAKLGLPAKATQCETCGSESSRDCDGE